MLRRDPLRDTPTLMRRVYAFVAYRIGDGPDAEDVVSETFERAFRYRASYDPTRGAPATWLIGIARRCIDDWASRRSTPTELPEEPLGPPAGLLEEDVVRHLDVVGALASLGDRDRELVALRFGADLAAREIAALLGMRTNAVEVALHRALARLRAALEGAPGEGEGTDVRISADRRYRG